MADITLTILAVGRSNNGLTPAFTSVNATDVYFAQNDGRLLLHVKNANAGAGTVTVQTPNTVDSQATLAITDLTATVPANTGDKMIGPFPPTIYNNVNGQIRVTFSLASGMTVAAIWLP